METLAFHAQRWSEAVVPPGLISDQILEREVGGGAATSSPTIAIPAPVCSGRCVGRQSPAGAGGAAGSVGASVGAGAGGR